MANRKQKPSPPHMFYGVTFMPRTQAGQQFIDPNLTSGGDVRYIPSAWDHEEACNAPGDRWVKYISDEPIDPSVVNNLNETMHKIDEAFYAMEDMADASQKDG